MVKNALIKGINSFMYAIGITVVIYCFVFCFSNGSYIPVIPEFASRFDSVTEAFCVQLMLIGISSASFGAGTVVMEMEHLSLLTQSVIYMLVTGVVWVSVGCYCWGLHKYPQTMLGVGITYVISYSISWIIQYRICKKSVEEINFMINELNIKGV